jgi:sugar porter (SP) family MFS transporter
VPLLALLLTLPSTGFGYNTGIVAITVPEMTDLMDLSPSQVGLLTGAAIASAGVGAAIATSVASRYGRAALHVFSSAFQVVGSLAFLLVQSSMAPAGAYAMSVVIRLVCGVGIGCASVSTPLVLAESARPEKRGMLGVFNQIAVAGGVLLSYLTGYLTGQSWQVHMALGAVPCLVLLVAMLFLRVETPAWLESQQRYDEARAGRIRLGLSPFDESLLTSTAEQVPSESALQVLFSHPRKPVIIAIMVAVFQQLSGINALLYYLNSILKEAGLKSPEQIVTASVLIALWNMLMSFPSVPLIDRLGRRVLLLAGSVGTALSMIALVIGHAAHASGTLSVVLVSSFIFFFAWSWGPIPFVLAAEVFPTHQASAGVSVSLVVNWTCNTALTFATPLLLAHLGPVGVFSLFSGVMICSGCFAFFYLPETKGLNEEQMDRAMGRVEKL